MGGGYSKMKKQAKMMQEQMEKMKEDLKNKTVSDSVPAGQSTSGGDWCAS